MFHGKTVLITGASSGIGEEFSIQFAESGADLILVARSKGALEELSSRLKSRNLNIQVTVMAFDLCRSQDIESLKLKVIEMGLSVDYLVNNAGFGRFCQFETEDVDTYRRMLALNVGALTELAYAFLHDMKSKNYGGIINVASTASFQALPYQAVYGASKAYVLSFSEALSGELLGSNVHVMALCPGATKSKFMATANADVSNINMSFMAASKVVSAALRAFRKRRTYTVIGYSNYLMSLLPRFLPRERTVKIVARMFKNSILR